jgi:hypothetical protein
MLDFTSAALINAPYVMELERRAQRDSRKWQRVMRELERQELGALGFVASPRRLKELRQDFVSALDAAHAAGMTIDAYMSRGLHKISEPDPTDDPALSERAEWAGLNDAA